MQIQGIALKPVQGALQVCGRPRTCMTKRLESGEHMIQPRKISRVILALVFYSSSAIGAYGRSSSSLRSLTGQRGESMSFLAWVILGLVAGFIGSKIVNRRGEGILLDILLGVVGAFAGGWLFHIFGAPGVSGLNLYSLFVAVLGSVVLLVLYHAFRRRRAW
jgi:uncharacterized membrane protein YeaQ/YmgE (transglycosylase-associated protein family)